MESSKLFPANILCSPNTSSKDSEAIVDSPLSCSLESSEQNSPYTDSAVETLNILNHNFERWVRRVYHSHFVCNVKNFSMAWGFHRIKIYCIMVFCCLCSLHFSMLALSFNFRVLMLPGGRVLAELFCSKQMGRPQPSGTTKL